MLFYLSNCDVHRDDELDTEVPNSSSRCTSHSRLICINRPLHVGFGGINVCVVVYLYSSAVPIYIICLPKELGGLYKAR